jgi:hypothetical protein
MKAVLCVIVVLVVVFLGIAVSLNYASTMDQCGAECETKAKCAGPRGARNGNPVGCSSSCSGECEVCRNGTSSSFCEWTGDTDDECRTDTGSWTSCGDEYEADCEGSSSPCTCDSTESYVDGTCQIHFCS